MIRTVYIASVLGVVTFFFALALGVSWGMVIEKAGILTLAVCRSDRSSIVGLRES